MVPLIKIKDVDHEWKTGGYAKTITLEIPMTIPRDKILEQVRHILKKYHPGQKLLKHRYSTAKCKLYPQPRAREEVPPKLLKVWQLKHEHPDWDFWEIGEALGASPDKKVQPGDTERTIAQKHHDLGSDVSRLYEQAEAMMYHALRGEFPRYPNLGKKEAEEERPH
jgi:hypothetical protein